MNMYLFILNESPPLMVSCYFRLIGLYLYRNHGK